MDQHESNHHHPPSTAISRHSLATSALSQVFGTRSSDKRVYVALYRSMLGSTSAGTSSSPSAICLFICEQSAAVCAPTLAHGETYCGDSASGLGRPAEGRAWRPRNPYHKWRLADLAHSQGKVCRMVRQRARASAPHVSPSATSRCCGPIVI